jgi:hypothetical protein
MLFFDPVANRNFTDVKLICNPLLFSSFDFNISFNSIYLKKKVGLKLKIYFIKLSHFGGDYQISYC